MATTRKILGVTAGMHKSNSKMATQKPASDCATAQSGIISQLRNQIRSVETAGRVGGQARVSSGCAAIDRLLPEGGYQRGTLVQWLTGGGQAADYLSLLAAKRLAWLPATSGNPQLAHLRLATAPAFHVDIRLSLIHI